ncbi:MAG: hypothetical protein KAT12_04195 [Gammaproteobacteria bacterium]|nr:hypothetical protein [Gammaproteobacteria bacterium]
MNQQYTYSDEHISAYIDNELDSEERAQFLSDEQTDEDFAQRINEIRMLKEKVQLSYSELKYDDDEKKSFSCTAFFSRHRALAASLLLLSVVAGILSYNMSSNDNLMVAKQLMTETQPISAASINDAVGENSHVVLYVSQYQPETFDETIDNIEALLQNRSDDFFKLEIVANGQGLKALDTKSSLHAAQVNQLTNKFNNLKVVACAKSLTRLATEGNPIQLMQSIMIAPSAADQVAKRTSAGWLFLKI